MKHLYRLWLGLCVILALSGPAAWGQNVTITSISPGGPFCGNDNATVSFTVDGAGFAAAETINAQISDGTGSFASPQLVGSFGIAAAATSGSVSITMPIPTSTGTAYVIRLIVASTSAQSTNTSAQFTINPNVGLVTITGPTTACSGVTTAYTVSAPNAQSLTYGNSNGFFTAPGDANFTAAGPAVLTVHPTGCGLFLDGTLNVTVLANVGTASLTGPDNACLNIPTAYVAAASNATGFNYSNTGGTIDAAGNATFTVAGLATITATPTGCGTLTPATKSVNVLGDVGAVNLTGPTTACIGPTVVYTATAANATGFAYSNSGGSIDASGNATFATAGTATITATPTGCGTLTPATVNVSVANNVGAVTLTGPDPACTNVATVYTASATNATGFTYTNSNGTIDASGTAIFTTTGTGTITATPTGCGSLAAASKSVNILGDVGAVSISGPADACIGPVATFTASAANATSITYATSNGTIDASGNAIFTAPGATTITATPSGCGTLTAGTKAVTVHSDVGTVSFTGPTTACVAPSTYAYTASAPNATGFNYSSTSGTISAVGVASFATPGSATVTATPTGCGTLTPANVSVSIAANVTTPVFAKGSTSTRCASTLTDTYVATASNSTPIVYTVDLLSAANGVTVNSSGVVSFSSTYLGPTTVTATSSGCNPGIVQATHTISVAGNVTPPAFVTPAVTSRCQGGGQVNYTIAALNSTSYTYVANDPLAGSFGTGLNAGVFTFDAAYSGTVVITATANGCGGPLTTTATTVVASTVGTPLFTLGPTTARCQGAGNVQYLATAANSSGITYSLSPLIAGNINSTTGVVTYFASYSGPTAVITASAAGCNGPATAQHTVSFTPLVGKPVFDSGITTVRCQGPQTIVYSANVTNGTIAYSSNDPAASPNPVTGAIVYTPGYFGTVTVKAVATGCNASKDSSIHIVTVNASPVIGVSLANQTVCEGASTATIILSSSVNNTQYTWINSNPSIGGNPSGTTSSNIPSFVTTNAKKSLDSAVFTISPIASGCVGLPINAIVRVVPTPEVSPLPPGIEFCHGTRTTSAIHFTSTIVGLPLNYTWTNSNPGMGLAASGNDSIPVFTPNNTGILPVTTNIRATPSIIIASATCVGADAAVGTIKVKPLPQIVPSISDSSSVCSDSLLNFSVNSSIPGAIAPTSFAWSRPGAPPVLNQAVDSVLSSSVSETLISSPSLSPTYVNYFFDLAADGCILKDQRFTVIVNPTPQEPGSPTLSLPIEKICAGAQRLNLAAGRQPDPREFFKWSGPATAPIIQKTDSTQSDHALVSFTTPNVNQDSTTISVIAVVRGFNCPSRESKANFKVQQASMPQVRVGRISNNLVAQTNVGPNEKLKFQWGYDTYVGLTGNYIEGATDQFLWVNDSTAPHKFDTSKNMYWVQVKFNDNCTQKAYYNGPSPLGIFEAQKETAELELYPNPAQDILNVKCLTKNNSNVSYQLLDLAGKNLGTYKAQGLNTKISLSDLAPGYYVLQCIQDGRRIAYGRFIKQ